jgi:two-component system, cell cycle sensor histidine kinase and response regulator CckA
VNDVIHNMTKMFVRFLTENVELSSHLDPRLDHIAMDKSQLEQVLLNLVLNARDAMPKGGVISITSTNVIVADRSVRGAFGIPAGAYVLITVSDSGTGMSAETMKHLFEPFYTTKGLGTGTGLGLATVYGILKQSGGDICVETSIASGSTFKIYLPKAAQVATVSAETLLNEPASKTGETILVVEDESIVRRVVVKTLQKNGYKVLEVARGHLALQLCKGYKETIDLLLTEVMMPGMNGRQLAESPECKSRNMAVLFMSGHTYDVITRNELLAPGFAFIEKTFTANALCLKVRQVLDDFKLNGASAGVVTG